MNQQDQELGYNFSYLSKPPYFHAWDSKPAYFWKRESRRKLITACGRVAGYSNSKYFRQESL